MNHYVYIVKCADSTLYCGYTTNMESRLYAHNNLVSGAKYTRTRRPVVLVYTECFDTKAEALRREFQIKSMPRVEKLLLIASA